MSSSETPTLLIADTPAEVEAVVRQLITNLRDVSRGGRLLVDRFAELLKRAVDEYCVEFEHRADDLLLRLERTR